MRQLGDLISTDPSFSSEVLTIANSALYANRSPITSILQAIAILGTNKLKGVCLAVGVRAYLARIIRETLFPCCFGGWGRGKVLFGFAVTVISA